MRTYPPRVFESVQRSFDVALSSSLERIITAYGPRVFVVDTYGDHAISYAGIIDLTGSSPLTQTGMTDFMPDRAVINVAQHKCVKGDVVTLLKRIQKFSMVQDIGARADSVESLPLSFSYLGRLEEDAVTLLKRIQKFSTTQDIRALVAARIFNSISFAIVKGVGAQIVSRFPSNFAFNDAIADEVDTLSISLAFEDVVDVIEDPIATGSLRAISGYVDIRTRYYNIKNYSFSAIDHIGHGTHVESITDNNYVKGASYYVRNVLCYTTDLLSAFDDAIADGVDVQSVSLDFKDAFDVTEDPIAIGTILSVERNILTSVVARNDCLILGSIESFAPRMITPGPSDINRSNLDKVLKGNEAIIVVLSDIRISAFIYLNIWISELDIIALRISASQLETIPGMEGSELLWHFLGELRETSNSTDLSKMWTVMMESKINIDMEITRKLLAVLIDLEASLNMRHAIINEGKVKKNTKIVKSVAFFRELQDRELPLKRDLMLQIDETHMSTFEKRENILTSVATGNDGLVFGSIQNSTPWMIIAGASDTERRILNKLLLGNEAILVEHIRTRYYSIENLNFSARDHTGMELNMASITKVLGELRETSNSTDLSKMWAVMMEREINTNLETTRKLLAVLIDLEASLNRRHVIINEGRLAVYKVRNVLCYTTDLLSAFDDAIADGVDVQSILLAFEDAFDVTEDPISIGTILSVERNILTSVVVGNDGLIRDSIESFASWMINPGPSDINQSILDKVLKVNEAIIVVSFRKHWKEVHVTWAQLEKKQDKDATLQDFDGALGFTVRGDGVAIPSDAVKA
ncbi:subtilisin-like protease SBT4.3 [Tanacetum coccineum]|uniref:Subtilisin-like protease SBT4.3 n=1 Tax=Tanacetum coccineum TaxID=301880 RepID=A0ABQ5CDM8_9ASTR